MFRKSLNITAFIIGGFLGASTIFAISPKSRQQVTKDLKLKSEKYLKRVKKTTNEIITNSKTSAEMLQRKAEDIMNTVQQYARDKMSKPVSLIENEINGLKAAIIAAKASYSLNPEIQLTNVGEFLDEFDDESLPKQIGMGKGRNRKGYSL